MSHCRAPGCSRPTSGCAVYCNSHKARARRHGDPRQEGITKAHLKPYLDAIRLRIARNPDNPAWKMIEGEWLGMVDDARAELSRYRAGIREDLLQDLAELVERAQPADDARPG